MAAPMALRRLAAMPPVTVSPFVVTFTLVADARDPDAPWEQAHKLLVDMYACM